jgi:hypothetical protein
VLRAAYRHKMRYDETRMKPEPPPKVPGKTEWQRFDNAVRSVLNVSKEDVLKEEARLKQPRQKKRTRRKVAAKK